MAGSDRDGIVFLVGGGPGDPGLLTRRGAEVLASADVVIHDGLVSGSVVALANPSAERIYAGKKRSVDGAPRTQEEINRLLVTRAEQGQRVVRLKGGDPFVFGRGAEEVRVLAEAGVAFEVVPGVTAATAVPAYAGIPLTARDVTSTVALVTGHEDPNKPESAVDWDAVSRAGTVVLFMALSNLEECAERLIACGRDPKTPAAAIYWGTTGAQRTVTGTLDTLAAECSDAGLIPPVLVVIGGVVALRTQLGWFESRPLFGKRVLITRSGSRALALATQVSELGGEPVVFPVTEVVRAGDASDIDAACQRLASGGFRWVVFASANAADHFMSCLRERDLDARSFAGAGLAAIGEQTRAALDRHGLRADVVPRHGDAANLADAVRAASGAATSVSVLVPRAQGGRPELVDGLAQTFDDVVPLEVYRTAARSSGDPLLANGLRKLKRGNIEVALVFAPSQVRALQSVLGDSAEELLGAIAIVGTVGKTTAAALERAGFRADVVASRPDAEQLLAEVVEALASVAGE